MPRTSAAQVTPCGQCPLRRLPIFQPCDGIQLDFIETFKIGEQTIARGETVYTEGMTSPYLYTVLRGWAFRSKSLPDGRRQIVNYALAGDFIGLQNAMMAEMEHTIEALTDMRLCVFPRDRLFALFEKHPPLGFDMTWLAAREERFLDDNMLAVGRRTAVVNIAYLISHLFARARELDLVRGDKLDLPITQQHFADTLGLSQEHLNKSLRKLRSGGLVTVVGRSMIVQNEAALLALAKGERTEHLKRPLI